MPRFQVINDLNQIPTAGPWRDSAKFNSKERLVDENGNAVDTRYAGRKFLIIAKKERDLTLIEKVTKVCNPAQGMSSDGRMKIRYAIDMDTLSRICEKELQEGINIPKQTINKIQGSLISILGGYESRTVTVYDSCKEHCVFTVDGAPNLIFKMQRIPNPPKNTICEIQSKTTPQQVVLEQSLPSLEVQQKSAAKKITDLCTRKTSKSVEPLPLKGVTKASEEPLDEDSMKVRYRRMVEGMVEIRLNKLGLLIIPRAKMFTVSSTLGDEYDIIAEQMEDIVPDSVFQEIVYDNADRTLDEAIRQLAVFICRTGYSDVETRNNPVHSSNVDQYGNRSFVLIDLDAMDDVLTDKKGAAEIGLFGKDELERTGLVRLVNKKQAEMVKKVAQEHFIPINKFEEAVKMRAVKWEENRILKERVEEFHRSKNIVEADQPIVADPNSPGLAAELKRKSIRKDVMDDVVAAINAGLKNVQHANLVKRKRWIDLDGTKAPLNKYYEADIIAVLVAFENHKVIFSTEVGVYSNLKTHYHIQA